MAKVLLKGNEAIAEAAVRAGLVAYFGYPITPQTELLEYLARRMTELGRVFLQAEVSFLDAQGRTRDVKVSDPIAVHEAEFFPGLTAFLKAKGLEPVNVTEPEAQKETA